MDLSTTYLGLTLPHPFMPGASPLVDDLDTVQRLEDAGAVGDRHALALRGADPPRAAEPRSSAESHGESYAEALSYFPRPGRASRSDPRSTWSTSRAIKARWRSR